MPETKPLIFVFDLETTGLPHQSHRVVPIQIEGVLLNPNLPGWPELDRFSALIKIPESSTLQPFAMGMHRNNRRNYGYYQTYGKSPVEVYEQLAELLTKYTAAGHKIRLGGHNAATFDIPLLKRDSYQCGVDFDTIADYHSVDTMIMADVKHGVTFGDGTLTRLGLKHVSKYLGFDFDESKAHDATYDLEATVFCLRKLVGAI